MVTAQRQSRFVDTEGVARPDHAWRRIRSLVGENGTEWSEGPIRRVRHLTEREFDVFILLGRGLSNQDVSHLLLVTERTVKANVTRILAKLQLESRLQAGLVAQTYTRTASPQSCMDMPS